MTRQEFIKICSILGVGTPLLPSLLTACNNDMAFYPAYETNFQGKVLIIGAGAAGMTAGYILKRHNIDFQIIEASSVYGGRVKELQGFADFPIDLGAEWIHTNPSVLAKILNDKTQKDNIDIINYAPETLYFWDEGKLKKKNFLTNFYGEHKFKNTTWFSFFDKYIAPHIINNIVLNSPVKEIDYTSDKVKVKNTSDEIFEADKVIVTVPLTILQEGLIDFKPAYPTNKIEAFKGVYVPDGIKVFMEFSERFYPDMLIFGSANDFVFEDSDESIYYDAAFRKDSGKNILALFAVGDKANRYTDLPTDEALIAYILKELDEVFEGKASQHYIKHKSQNWSKEPFIRGSYSHYENDGVQEVLSAPIDNKIYFAGEAYAYDYSTVHGAADSAYKTVEQVLS